MNRRLAGLLVVLLTVVGVAVAQAPGRRLAGAAVAAEFPVAPSAGDCLIDPLDHRTRFPFERDRQVPQWGTCEGHMTLGEVVAIRSPAPADLSDGLDERVGCRPEALGYAGLVPRDGRFGTVDQVPDDPISWEYSIAAHTGWIAQVPWSARASAWAACVVTPIDGNSSVGSLAGSFAGGRLPDEYGTCWKSPQVDASIQTISCSLPHAAELVAIGKVDDPATLSSERIVSSCVDQARLVMHRDDPTMGGLLAVRVAPDGSVFSPRTRNVTCFLTAADHRMLMGSAIGLGAGEVRFAG